MEIFMSEALKEAEIAGKAGDVPIGCVIEKDGEIIAKGHNEVELRKDPTAHAEILAIKEATQKLGYARLTGCRLFVTLEPCAMCAGAIVQARLTGLIIGAMDPKAGACGSVFNIVEEPQLNHRVAVTCGVMAEPCGKILTDFFADLRKKKGGSK